MQQKWGVKPGDLWLCGEHRVICGDATDADVVARVLGPAGAQLALCDPPYNVGEAYVDTDDNLHADDYENFCRAWFGLAAGVTKKQIVTPGCNNLALWVRWFTPYHIAPWIKTNSLTNGKVSSFWCWEPIAFWGAPDEWGWEGVLFFGEGLKSKRANDVFDFPIGSQKEVGGHPCPKPLALWVDLLNNFTQAGDVVFDPFLGSGTTLIGCEQTGRVCRGIEISPEYLAVCLERWSNAAKQKPRLVEEA